MIRDYSKPKEHYTVYFVKIFKGIPCNMAKFYRLPAENWNKIFDICLLHTYVS